MKRAFLAATALMSSTIMSTPALATAAAGPNPPTTAAKQAVCDALDTDGPSGTDYQVVLNEGSTDAGTPTNDLSTIADIESTRVADHSSSSVPYGTRAFYGVPGKHGGSVNLFATIGYPGITYDGSFVDQNVDRVQTDTYNFSCQVQHWEVVGSHDEVVPAVGQYVWDGVHGKGKDCDAHNANHPEWWGIEATHDNCVFEGTLQTTTSVDDYDFVDFGTPVDESLTDGPYYVDTVVYATQVSSPVDVTETDAAPYFAGDILVCNNPGRKGGTWTAQNGWTDMTKCTTTYFNTAPYISGANVFHSASLPAL